LAVYDKHEILTNKQEVRDYLEKVAKRSEQERISEGKEKTGVQLKGVMAINPVTKEEIPLFVADYVLGNYGTGAIMAVPAHDQRDFEFAKQFNLPIKTVISGKSSDLVGGKGDGISASGAHTDEKAHAYTGSGVLVNSADWDGWMMPDEKDKVISWLEEKGLGKRESNYHLRDWLISRQRYWGPPIPLVFCQACFERGDSWFTTKEAKDQRKGANNKMRGWYPVPEADLPVELPFLEDYKPMGTGKAPLANSPEFYETTCPHCGGKAQRETDVSDTFLDSAWYFLRYLATDRDDIPFPSAKFGMQPAKFLPVTMYIGGAEHSVLHLLYARFITMVLHDLDYLDFEEPFKRFYAHGLIIKDGAKMSKSKGNVINPDIYIKKYGVDSVRLYLRFLGPFDQTADFRDSGIEGMNRFVKRLWSLFTKTENLQLKTENQQQQSMMHRTIREVTEEMEHLRFNTAIAKLMSWYNFLAKQEEISREEVETYLKLLAPFAPFMTEELYQSFNNNEEATFQSIHTSPWPTYDKKFLLQDSFTIAVQVNGKLRGTLEVSPEEAKDRELIEAQARQDEGVSKFLEDGQVKQVIFVPGKVINFVVR